VHVRIGSKARAGLPAYRLTGWSTHRNSLCFSETRARSAVPPMPKPCRFATFLPLRATGV
jgi:hypothetical protein